MPAVLALVVLTAYLPALNGEMIWDDRILLTENSVIAGSVPWTEAFRQPFQPFEVYYRPVTALAFRFLHAAAGGAVWPLHLAGLILHLLIGAGLYRLCRWARLGRYTALASAGIFLLHPALTETVAWISALGDLLAGALLVAAALAWLRALGQIRGSGSFSPSWALLSLFCYGLAVLAKETAAVFVLLAWIPVATGTRHGEARNEIKAPGAARWPRWLLWGFLPQLALLGVVLWMRASAQHTPVSKLLQAVTAGSGPGGNSLDSVGDAALPWILLGRYLLLVPAPSRLNLYHVVERPSGPADPAVLAGMLGLFLILTLLYAAWRLRPRALLGGAWFLATLAPVILFTPAGTNLFSERYLYIPAIGLALLAAGVLEPAMMRLAARFPGGDPHSGGVPADLRRGGVVLLGIVATACLVGTVRRTVQWRTEETLLLATLDQEPRAAAVAANLGLAWRQAGKTEETLELYAGLLLAMEESRPIYSTQLQRTSMQRIAFESGILLAQMGNLEPAERAFRAALSYEPGDERSLASLGAVLGNQGRLEEARDALQRGVSIHPRSVLLRENLAASLLRLGQTEAARREFETLLTLQPGHPRALEALRGLDEEPASQ